MSNAKCRIKSGDQVIVTTGKDRGTVGRVVRVMPSDRQVIVEGVRRVRRHRKPVGETPGGIIEKEMPIDISNVALWNAAENRRVKVTYRVLEDGRKVRVDRKTNAVLDQDQG
ncbi:MAG: 50S ribosomal protein L24 [Alphaproteobacteria bacterium]|nr:50S ribosomal protein L24 [Alphaproteobacteria bacterium]MCB9696130.1 50S ribosomal protein L24 [Alphaproteobacteria bacterium]